MLRMQSHAKAFGIATKHLFANAMIGFAELVSTNNGKLRNASEDAIESLFWEWCEFEVGETSYKTFSKFYKQHVA